MNITKYLIKEIWAFKILTKLVPNIAIIKFSRDVFYSLIIEAVIHEY